MDESGTRVVGRLKFNSHTEAIGVPPVMVGLCLLINTN